MLDSPKKLLDKIRLGEDSSLELKELRFAGNRVQAPSQEALADELAAIRFDEQTVPGATLDDLDAALWERFRTELSEDDRETFLHKLAIARQDDDGIWRPTVAGLLMATKDPRR